MSNLLFRLIVLASIIIFALLSHLLVLDQRVSLSAQEVEILEITEDSLQQPAPDAPPTFSEGIFNEQWSPQAIGVLHEYTQWSYEGKRGAKHRIKSARNRIPELKKIFKNADVDWPPAEIYLRAFKAEGELELWANTRRGKPMKPVITWKLCALSGEFGPKRREGDAQVPEGFYHLDYYNSQSSYHLSMRINYPNRSDRILGDRKNLGSAIMIHGNCASIGCLAMTDQRIEELWAITEAVRGIYPRRRVRTQQIPVMVSPSRKIDHLLQIDAYQKHHALWRSIKEAEVEFERTRRPVKTRVNSKGLYQIIKHQK